MVALHLLDRPLPAKELGARLLKGEILVWREVEALAELRIELDRIIRQTLADDAPTTAEKRLPGEVFIERIRQLRSQVMKDLKLHRLMKTAMEYVGLDLDDSYWDALQLRVVPSAASHQARRIMPLPMHRDNWGSNIAQQLNWWTPIYPTDADNTLAFYPAYWSQAVENDSANWDYLAFKQRMREGKAASHPVLPTLTESLPAAQLLPLVIQPGDLLAFSGQHLHGSIANTHGRSRFSLETRTVSRDHITTGLAAPAPDGAAPYRVWEWFKHMRDGTPLGETERL